MSAVGQIEGMMYVRFLCVWWCKRDLSSLQTVKVYKWYGRGYNSITALLMPLFLCPLHRPVSLPGERVVAGLLPHFLHARSCELTLGVHSPDPGRPLDSCCLVIGCNGLKL